jgi:phospholipase C
LGPNGFVREFYGQAGVSEIDVALAYLVQERAVEFRLANRNEKPLKLSFQSSVYRPAATKEVEIAAHGTVSLRQDVATSGNWYDIALLTAQGFGRRFAGRMETGKNSVSDPAMGAPADE